MTAHLSDSDRQALRLAHELREELRQALPPQVAAPSISPFVDPSGRPSVLLRMDEGAARAMMALLMARRAEQVQPGPEGRRADGTHVPPGTDPSYGAPPPHQAAAPPAPVGGYAAPMAPAPVNASFTPAHNGTAPTFFPTA